MDRRQVLIQFRSKNCPVEKAQADQNAFAKGVEKIKRACQTNLHEPWINKTDA